jgi:hypothetical protein
VLPRLKSKWRGVQVPRIIYIYGSHSLIQSKHKRARGTLSVVPSSELRAPRSAAESGMLGFGCAPGAGGETTADEWRTWDWRLRDLDLCLCESSQCTPRRAEPRRLCRPAAPGPAPFLPHFGVVTVWDREAWLLAGRPPRPAPLAGRPAPARLKWANGAGPSHSSLDLDRMWRSTRCAIYRYRQNSHVWDWECGVSVASGALEFGPHDRRHP